MNLKQWKKWLDFFKKEGRHILVQAQDSKIDPAQAAYLKIPEQAPLYHLHGLIPPMRKALAPEAGTISTTVSAAPLTRPGPDQNPCPRYLLP